MDLTTVLEETGILGGYKLQLEDCECEESYILRLIDAVLRCASKQTFTNEAKDLHNGNCTVNEE